jgi:hypothetical protein
MFYVEDFCRLTDDQEHLVNEILGNNFPFYFKQTTNDLHGFTHVLMGRDSQRRPTQGIIYSRYYHLCHRIFSEFCLRHRINVNVVLRAAINYSNYYHDKSADIHTDHDFPHFNFLCYLTSGDYGATLIHDSEDNVIKSIKPEKYKAVIFPGLPHSVEAPDPAERRVVMVFTFLSQELSNNIV